MGGSNLGAGYGDGPSITRIAGVGNGGNFLELTDAERDQIEASTFSEKPTYKHGSGPITVTVVDPLRVEAGDFELTMVDTATKPGNFVPLTSNNLNAEEVSWVLVRLPSDTVWADEAINVKNEQVIIESTTGDKIRDWGLAVSIHQVSNPGENLEDDENGLIGWEVTWGDPSNEWLTAIVDNDATQALQFGYLDWIRSGIQGSRDNYNDPSWHDYSVGGEPIDAGQTYEGVWNGRVAPFRLVANNSSGTGRPQNLYHPFGYSMIGGNNLGIENTASIDLVITDDKSKWTECVMLELGEDPGLNEGGANKFGLRTGQLNYVHDGNALKPGKTVFPGYAVNVETGERLNIIIGEDSYQIGENGRDMKWNPTDNAGFYNQNYPSFGGRHYIYIMGSHQGLSASLHPKLPTYDRGEEYYNRILNSTNNSVTMTQIFQNCMWVVPSYLSAGNELKENSEGIPVPPSDFTLKVRVNRSYANFDRTTENFGNPKYEFSTEDIMNDISDSAAIAALDLINVVPNPYYGFSGYENSQIENKVKFTNLPAKCDISIYTLDGALVRRIRKDDESTEAVWDMKNSASVPIASGLYIIHVDAGDLGEKILKWMGIMRELDLDSF
jgi:hypothetical protein